MKMHYWFSMVISPHSSFFKTKNIQKQSFNFWWNLGWFIIYMKKRFVTHFCSVWGMRRRNMLIKCTKLRKNIRKICHSYVGKLVLIFGWCRIVCLSLLYCILSSCTEKPVSVTRPGPAWHRQIHLHSCLQFFPSFTRGSDKNVILKGFFSKVYVQM